MHDLRERPNSGYLDVGKNLSVGSGVGHIAKGGREGENLEITSWQPRIVVILQLLSGQRDGRT